MKAPRYLILSILFPAAAFAAEPATAPTTAPISPAIQAILAAPDPSATIEAYARGVSSNPNDVELERAYVRHMVDLGAPEMADAQSHDLVKRGAADPLAMGVAAYNDAARGNAAAAIANLKPALTLQPDDPFLLRTAGQVVAWYDGTLDRSSLSKDDVAAIEWLRSAGTGRDEFAEAYRMATDARRQAPAASSTEPAAADSASVAPTPSSPPPTTYYNSYPMEDDGYVSSGYRYYYPYYAYSYWPVTYWPTYSIIRIRDCDFHHSHHFNQSNHFDRFDHRGVEIHRWDSSRRWNGIITRPDGWVHSPSSVTRSPRNFVGPLPVDPGSNSFRRGGQDGGRSNGDGGLRTLSRDNGGSSQVTRSPAPIAGPRQAPSSADRGNRGGDRPAAVAHPKYDSPQPEAPARSAPPARSSGGGGNSGSSSSGGRGSRGR